MTRDEIHEALTKTRLKLSLCLDARQAGSMSWEGKFPGDDRITIIKTSNSGKKAEKVFGWAGTRLYASLKRDEDPTPAEMEGATTMDQIVEQVAALLEEAGPHTPETP